MAPKSPTADSGPKTPAKILVLRYSSLGDVALTNPVLDGLKAAFPGAQVYFATKPAFAPAIQNHPALARILYLKGSGFFNLWGHIREIRDLKPDLVLDLHDSLRTRIIASFLGKARVLVYDKDALRRRMLVKKLNLKPGLHTIQKYLRV